MLRGQWPNHPATKWAHASDANYRWLWCFAEWCCHEYSIRFGRTHGSLFAIRECGNRIDAPKGDFTPPAFHPGSASYREHLAKKHAAWVAKGRPAKWTRREVPEEVKA